MKTTLIFTFFVVSIGAPVLGEELEPKLQPIEATLSSDYAIPINKELIEAIRLVVKRSDCSLLRFFEMSGITFVERSQCSIDSSAQLLHLRTSHKAATRAVMVIGDLMVRLEGSQTPQQVADEYPDFDSPFAEVRPEQNNKENNPDMATPRKSSD